MAAVVLVVGLGRVLLADDVPTRNGWVDLAAFVGVLVVVWLVDLVLAPSPASVGVERTAPAVVILGHRDTITWRLTNPRARARRVSFADELAPSLHAEQRGATVVVPAEGQ